MKSRLEELYGKCVNSLTENDKIALVYSKRDKYYKFPGGGIKGSEDNTEFEQENFYYFCQVSGDVGKQHLDTYEAEAGFELQVVSIEDAIKVNKNFTGDDNFDQIMIDRDIRILELIAYQLKSEQRLKGNEG